MKEFNSYSDEKDPERIKQITEQAHRDIEWVAKKVSVVVELYKSGTSAT